jgi:hypothetical protein
VGEEMMRVVAGAPSVAGVVEPSRGAVEAWPATSTGPCTAPMYLLTHDPRPGQLQARSGKPRQGGRAPT